MTRERIKSKHVIVDYNIGFFFEKEKGFERKKRVRMLRERELLLVKYHSCKIDFRPSFR